MANRTNQAKARGGWGRIISILAVLALLAVGYWVTRDAEIRVPVTQEMLQNAVARVFPVERNESGAVLRLADPEIRLPGNGDRVTLGLTFSLSAGSLKGTGSLLADGGIRYDPDQKAFFLTDVKIQRLDVNGLPGRFADPVRRVAESALKTIASSEPVYRLNDKNVYEGLAGRSLKRVNVANGQLVAVFGLR